MYEHLRANILNDEETDVQSLTDEQISVIRTTYPGIPEEYLTYLLEIGWGAIAMSFVVYRGPISFSAIYSNASVDESIVLLGDNMAGKCMGYDTSTWDVVEVRSDGTPKRLNTTFDVAIGKICNEIFEESED